MEFRGEKSDGLKVRKPKKRKICFNGCVNKVYEAPQFFFPHTARK